MIRLVIFAHDVKEIHGFKLLANCNEADYDGILQQQHGIGSTTALFDACINGIEASTLYGANLIKQDFSANSSPDLKFFVFKVRFFTRYNVCVF
jgi:hypothetical protein